MQAALYLTPADVQADLGRVDVAIDAINAECRTQEMDLETRAERVAERRRLMSQRSYLLARLVDVTVLS